MSAKCKLEKMWEKSFVMLNPFHLHRRNPCRLLPSFPRMAHVPHLSLCPAIGVHCIDWLDWQIEITDGPMNRCLSPGGSLLHAAIPTASCSPEIIPTPTHTECFPSLRTRNFGIPRRLSIITAAPLPRASFPSPSRPASSSTTTVPALRSHDPSLHPPHTTFDPRTAASDGRCGCILEGGP